jgi:hypothetical membrane protein
VALRFAAICGLLTPVTFIAGWLIGGLAQPDEYSVIDHDISDLGALTADKPWLYNQLGANLSGILVFVLALGLWRAVGAGLSARIGVIALGMFGVGQFLDGLFRLDCRAIDAGCDNSAASWHETAHEIESPFTILGLLVAMFALARAFKRSTRWRNLWVASLVAGIVTLVTLVALLPVGAGLAERIASTAFFVWVALVSYRLLRIADDHDAQLSVA